MRSQDQSPEPHPQIFLRQKNASLYYADVGGWTSRPEKARSFRDVAEASTFARSSAAPNLEIVIRTSSGEYCSPIVDPRVFKPL